MSLEDIIEGLFAILDKDPGRPLYNKEIAIIKEAVHKLKEMEDDLK